MTAQSSKALPADQPPATVLQTLHRDRAGLAAEATRLTGVLTRLQAEAAAGASLNDELVKLSEAETSEMKAWAAGGAVGTPPKGKQTERQAIAVKLAGANANAAAAKAAGADIDNKIAEINHQLAAVDQAIEKAGLDILQVDFGDLHDQHLVATEAARKLAAKLHGLCSFLSGEGRRRIDTGDNEGGRRFLARAEALTAVKLASPGVTQGEIIQAASEWGRRISDLRKGSS